MISVNFNPQVAANIRRLAESKMAANFRQLTETTTGLASLKLPMSCQVESIATVLDQQARSARMLRKPVPVIPFPEDHLQIEPMRSAAESVVMKISTEYKAQCTECKNHPRRRVVRIAYIHDNIAIVIKSIKAVDELIKIVGDDPFDGSERIFHAGVASVAWEVKVVEIEPSPPKLRVLVNDDPEVSDRKMATLRLVKMGCYILNFS